jgi:glycosyltransferase involved in cell wall biosynthesis
VLIANFRAEGSKIGNLNILKQYSISDDCISFWENEAEAMLAKIKAEYGDKKNLLYVVSAGPMSGPIIADLFRNNPNNCYVDFGSSIDLYYRGKITRPYMRRGNVYAKRNCCMDAQANLDSDISVVCTLYKKPQVLQAQVSAIKNQTINPKEILLFQDGIEQNYKIKLLDSLITQFDDVCISETNVGVWGRFKYAQKAKGNYVCVFDDDTIPGERWLENCLIHMQEEEAIYGTIGVIFTKDSGYPNSDYFKVGWEHPYSKKMEVDFVCHSWFFKREWLKYMLSGTEKYANMKYAAEDMNLSAQCQKHGIKTYVPPHPWRNMTMWGSNPKIANHFGTTFGAISVNPNNLAMMKKAVKMLEEENWQHVYKRNKTSFKMAKISIWIEGCFFLALRIARKIKRRMKRVSDPSIFSSFPQ